MFLSTPSPTTTGDGWQMVNGDCIEELGRLPAASADLSVFSPPFSSLFTYSASPKDIGNCASLDEFLAHLGFMVSELLRVTKPGRLACCHIANTPAMLSRDGYIGMKDLRGDLIRLFIGKGWIYHGEVCIDKDPQAQAIRTKSKGLLFVQMNKDSSWSRPALADYIIVFRAPGENAVPVTHPEDNPIAALSNDDWISWARPIWYGIRESDTLNAAVARGDRDERHICPLQLGTIERCVRLWSNPGDLVLSPFGGIGSEGYESIRWGRRYLGIELKPEYYRVACQNLAQAEHMRLQGELFGAV